MQPDFQEYFNPDLQMMKEKRTTIESIDIVPKISSAVGQCFSVRPKPEVVKKGITSIAFTTHMDMSVYLGYPGQYMYNTRTRVNIMTFHSITMVFYINIHIIS